MTGYVLGLTAIHAYPVGGATAAGRSPGSAINYGPVFFWLSVGFLW